MFIGKYTGFIVIYLTHICKQKINLYNYILKYKEIDIYVYI